MNGSPIWALLAVILGPSPRWRSSSGKGLGKDPWTRNGSFSCVIDESFTPPTTTSYCAAVCHALLDAWDRPENKPPPKKKKILLTEFRCSCCRNRHLLERTALLVTKRLAIPHVVMTELASTLSFSSCKRSHCHHPPGCQVPEIPT